MNSKRDPEAKVCPGRSRCPYSGESRVSTLAVWSEGRQPPTDEPLELLFFKKKKIFVPRFSVFAVGMARD